MALRRALLSHPSVRTVGIHGEPARSRSRSGPQIHTPVSRQAFTRLMEVQLKLIQDLSWSMETACTRSITGASTTPATLKFKRLRKSKSIRTDRQVKVPYPVLPATTTTSRDLCRLR